MVRRFGSLSTARRLSVAHLSGRQQPATAMILIDLENVGCRALQSSMDSLRSLLYISRRLLRFLLEMRF